MQTRDLLDVVAPYLDKGVVGKFFREKIVNYLVGISGKFTFVCICDYSTNNEQMSGIVYLLANGRSRRSIKALRNLFGTKIVDHDDFAQCNNAIRIEATDSAIANCSFVLDRNGKLVIDSGEETSDIEACSLDLIVANQMYYFIKDIAHIHQHHEPHHDNIISLSAYTKNGCEQWIKDTQHSLYRAVIRYKRFRNERALFRASGILAYAQSFEKSHVSGSSITQNFNTKEIDRSLEISRAELQHYDQKTLARTEAVRNYFFAIFGFVISATFLVRLVPGVEIQPHPFLVKTTLFIASEPFVTFGLVYLVAQAASFITHRKDPASFTLVRSTFRWLQGFQMRWHVVFNLTVTAVFAYLCYFLLSMALN